MQTVLFRNYLNKLFAVLLCAVSFGAAAAYAQDKTLADGNPPLTASMVERYQNVMEWTLDAGFNSTERAAIEKQIVEYWRASDEKNIKAVLQTLDFETKVSNTSQAKRQEMQPKLKQAVLEALEKDSGDRMNALLLKVYRKNQSAAEDSGSGDLSRMVGIWRVLHGNSIVSVDQSSGRIGDGNSMIAEYDIKADGRVAFTLVLQQANYGCTTHIKTYKTGRALVSGSHVTFSYDAGGTTQSEDNCNARYNYTKKTPAEKETFDYQLKSENGKPQFCFANAKLKDCAIKVK
jgi:hypothetical protein